MEPTNNGKLLSMLGLCKKAGQLAFGTDRVTDAVRGFKPVYLVLFAEDASANTKKRIRNCCEYYQADCREVALTGEQIGKAIGKLSDISAVAVLDKHFADAIASRI
ncbi:MAG: 50S ribosomal protein L7ae [Ruminococcaceae bacterium]|nr:50S ribosomal protein L7ae [Oscillospiraceae bacterium]